MSGHWLAAAILVPLVAALLLLFEVRRPLRQRRLLSLVSCTVLLAVAIRMLAATLDGQVYSYAIGNWAAPFGIVLVLDPLSALMVALTSVLALPALIHGCRGDDKEGSNYHALFQFQLAGLNGAFLTGDLFNLFVFFEVLLIASYGLLLHGQGPDRAKAGLHYVLLNLIGSSIFLIGLGLIYASTGTLNMAHVGRMVQEGSVQNGILFTIAGALLLVVFALKAAILPLSFWLPRAYAAAMPSVAALFAIMTKVGLYGILRLWTLLFVGMEALPGDVAVSVPLAWLGLGTLALAIVGVLAANRIAGIAAWAVLISIGTLVVAISAASVEAWSAALYYLVHTTWLSGALFLLAGAVSRQRGDVGDHLRAGPMLDRPFVLGGMMIVIAMALAGLPPFSGFIGKVGFLQALPAANYGIFWALLLVSGFAQVIALSRAGSTLFWRPLREVTRAEPADWSRVCAVALLVVLGLTLAVAAEPLLEQSRRIAEYLLAPTNYINAVLGSPEVGQ